MLSEWPYFHFVVIAMDSFDLVTQARPGQARRGPASKRLVPCYQNGHFFIFLGSALDSLELATQARKRGPASNRLVSCYQNDHFLFFQYIFNIADVAISTGVGILIVFNKKIFSKLEQSDVSLEE